jgi:hypothetical protein
MIQPSNANREEETHPTIGIQVKEIWEIDRKKKEAAIQNGFEFTVLWESDVVNLTPDSLLLRLEGK